MLTGYGLYRDGALLNEQHLLPSDVDSQLAEDWKIASRADDSAFIWVGYSDPDPHEIATVSSALSLPQHLVEDALNPAVRPSFDWHGETAGFIVVKILEYADATSDVFTGQLAIFFNHSHVVTVRHGLVGNLSSVRHMINTTPKMTQHGPMAVIHAILNQIIDEYLLVTEGVAQDIREIEEAVFAPSRTDDAEAIYRLKRENLEIRRAVAPLYQSAQYFVAKTSPGIPQGLLEDFQDLGEHILRVADQVETQDQLLSTVLMASMSRQALQQNEDTRKISAWVAIAAVPTMIAGIYGMNFAHMPELSWVGGYPMALGIMALVCGSLFRMFKKSGWL